MAWTPRENGAMRIGALEHYQRSHLSTAVAKSKRKAAIFVQTSSRRTVGSSASGARPASPRYASCRYASCTSCVAGLADAHQSSAVRHGCPPAVPSSFQFEEVRTMLKSAVRTAAAGSCLMAIAIVALAQNQNPAQN